MMSGFDRYIPDLLDAACENWSLYRIAGNQCGEAGTGYRDHLQEHLIVAFSVLMLQPILGNESSPIVAADVDVHTPFIEKRTTPEHRAWNPYASPDLKRHCPLPLHVRSILPRHRTPSLSRWQVHAL